MTNQKHTVATDALETLGTIIDERAGRDAIHLAVEPVEAGESLNSGQHVFLDGGKAYLAASGDKKVGIVDPFLASTVRAGQRFWLVVYPRQITSLRHVWTHPSFPDAQPAPASTSKEWMMAWAKEHMSDDYFGEDGKISDELAYANAIEAGHDMSVGCYENARDHIDDEWWGHWEAITGKRGDRDGYFSCAC